MRGFRVKKKVEKGQARYYVQRRSFWVWKDIFLDRRQKVPYHFSSYEEAREALCRHLEISISGV